MKARNRSNALLVELLIVVLFFMLAATVLMRVFSAAHNQARRAELTNRALNEAQNVADRLIVADDPEAALAALGFSRAEAGWTLEREDYVLLAASEWEDREAGGMRVQRVRAEAAGEALFELPCSRYEEGQL